MQGPGRSDGVVGHSAPDSNSTLHHVQSMPAMNAAGHTTGLGSSTPLSAPGGIAVSGERDREVFHAPSGGDEGKKPSQLVQLDPFAVTTPSVKRNPAINHNATAPAASPGSTNGAQAAPSTSSPSSAGSSGQQSSSTTTTAAAPAPAPAPAPALAMTTPTVSTALEPSESKAVTTTTPDGLQATMIVSDAAAVQVGRFSVTSTAAEGVPTARPPAMVVESKTRQPSFTPQRVGRFTIESVHSIPGPGNVATQNKTKLASIGKRSRVIMLPPNSNGLSSVYIQFPSAAGAGIGISSGRRRRRTRQPGRGTPSSYGNTASMSSVGAGVGEAMSAQHSRQYQGSASPTAAAAGYRQTAGVHPAVQAHVINTVQGLATQMASNQALLHSLVSTLQSSGLWATPSAAAAPTSPSKPMIAADPARTGPAAVVPYGGAEADGQATLATMQQLQAQVSALVAQNNQLREENEKLRKQSSASPPRS